MNPKIIIRLGSHSEKEYVEKTIRLFDGVILGANLIEATPGATASLLIKLGITSSKVPYFIDPMTYAFGSYVVNGDVKEDLDWIKSEKLVKKKPVKDFKKSYKNLSIALGTPFSGAVENSKALTPASFAPSGLIKKMCHQVIDYQKNRIKNEFLKDEEFKQYADIIPLPSVLFAPYFYIEPLHADDWLSVMSNIFKTCASIETEKPVHGVVCIDESVLEDSAKLKKIRELADTGVKGIWLWFSKFYENGASAEKLKNLLNLVSDLKKKVEVYNMHGGFYSLALSKYGLSGISHGVGYGEQKDVVPIIGKSTPTVQYYLRSLREKFSVALIQRCFDDFKIKTPADFHKKVCNCTICKGVVSRNIDSFSEFGERHYAAVESKRLSQTPAAAKRCRYHFLLSRAEEKKMIAALDVQGIIDNLREGNSTWGSHTAMRSSASYVNVWINVLSESLKKKS